MKHNTVNFNSMTKQINSTSSLAMAKTAPEAWKNLISLGLDVKGRDEDFVGSLHTRLLQCSKPGLTLDDAIASVTIEQFVRSFFSIVEPYVDMLKDILKWFENAEAKTGPHSWKLAWDGGDIEEVKHFKKWIEQISQIQGYIEHPALSFLENEQLLTILHKAPSVQAARQKIFKADYRNLPASISDWLFNYEYEYKLSPNLAPSKASPIWMHSIWNCIQHALSELKNNNLNWQKAKDLAKAHLFSYTASDAFALNTICKNETDYSLRSLVVSYAMLLEFSDEQKIIDAEVSNLFSSVPTSSHLLQHNVSSLIAFLDLPIWSRRHEFYAAWVTSRLLLSCEDHEIEYFHEKGTISLPFKETKVARLLSTLPVLTLISERRTKIANPKGSGRVANVQPDLGFWRLGKKTERCELVVEVKHYKKASFRSWANVLEDYANAHPTAQIILVNYGAAGNALSGVMQANQSRCSIIGDLRPNNKIALISLNEAVLKAVGRPSVTTSISTANDSCEKPLIIIDRSNSTTVTNDNLALILSELISFCNPAGFSIADSITYKTIAPISENIKKIVSSQKNSESDFENLINVWLDSFSKIIFVTDKDGWQAIQNSNLSIENFPKKYGDDVFIMQIS